jgi:DNA-binding NarL/FixJ family response regulator
MIEATPGWTVVGEASNGRDGVSEALRLKPDIVILDVALPELNGLDATRRILQEIPRTEILVFTMHFAEDIGRQIIASGARGYVLKTDAEQNLAAAITALSQHRPFFTADITEMMLTTFVRREAAEVGETDPRPVTLREREIIQLVAEGKSSKQIASLLGISVKTVEAHRLNIMRKLRLTSVSGLVRYAIRNGIVGA